MSKEKRSMMYESLPWSPPFRHLVLIAALAAPVTAVAQEAPEDVITDPVRQEVESLRVQLDGWYLSAGIGSSISFTHNSNVVGNLDGANFQLGVLLNGRAQLHQGDHDWLTEARIQTTFSKTPNIEPFIKTADVFDLRTTYAYHIPTVPWLGPFARAGLSTQLFPGYTVQDKDLTVLKSRTDGTVQTQTSNAQEIIDLTDPFEPLQLRQLLGMFADAVTEPSLRLTFELGLGAQQVLTQDGFVLNDDSETDELELKQLEDFAQVGGELGMSMNAQVADNLTWAFRASALQPFYTSVDGGPTGIDATNVEISSKLSLRLASWASLDYVLEVRRVPLVVEDWQIQNGLLFTAGFNVESKPEAPAAAAQ
jgi:hypothetical protein